MQSFVFQLARNDIDVNKCERISNFMLGHKLNENLEGVKQGSQTVPATSG